MKKNEEQPTIPDFVPLAEMQRPRWVFMRSQNMCQNCGEDGLMTGHCRICEIEECFECFMECVLQRRNYELAVDCYKAGDITAKIPPGLYGKRSFVRPDLDSESQLDNDELLWLDAKDNP